MFPGARPCSCVVIALVVVRCGCRTGARCGNTSLAPFITTLSNASLPPSLTSSLPLSPSPCCADNNDGVNVDGVPNTNNRRVYVGNLSWNTAWQGLKDHMKTVGEGEGGREGGRGGREGGSEGGFSLLDRHYFVETCCGLPFPHQFLPPFLPPPLPPSLPRVPPVIRADVLLDATGRSKGCGLVEFKTPAQARQAIATLNNTDLDGAAPPSLPPLPRSPSSLPPALLPTLPPSPRPSNLPARGSGGRGLGHGPSRRCSQARSCPTSAPGLRGEPFLECGPGAAAGPYGRRRGRWGREGARAGGREGGRALGGEEAF
jgi:hypothetical protein